MKTATLELIKHNPDVHDSVIFKTDGYKYSHYQQLPHDATHISAYLESRGGQFPTVRWFGLQALLKRHLLQRVTMEAIDAAEDLITEYGAPFNRKGWEHIVTKYDGRLPLEIWSAPEGLDIPVHNVLMQVVNLDPEMAWLTTFVETVLQQVWAPTTVATLSAATRDLQWRDLVKTSDDPEAVIPFALHDFALRGLSSMEAGYILGLAHLLNYKGTDTVPALIEAIRFYGATGSVGATIPAGEHTEILTWLPDHEEDYFANILAQAHASGATIVAAPVDTYDMEHCVKDIICGKFRDAIKTSGLRFVVRPDSGDPSIVVPWVLEQLASAFGTQTNTKGYKVLHPSVRTIFGDGMTYASIGETNAAIIAKGFSTENVAYGMGGGLSQKINRDMQRFSLKGSAVKRDGVWCGMCKTVRTDPMKASMAGRLALVYNNGWSDYAGHHGYETVTLEQLHGRANILRPIYRLGEMLIDETWAEITARTLRVISSAA